MLAAAVITLLGFGALSIDTAYMRLSQAQAQDVADAASQAALIVLRQTGSTDQAQGAAQRVVASNRVAGRDPDIVSIDFGAWDDTDPSPSFGPATAVPNAVRVTVGRQGTHAIPLMLARIWNFDSFDVQATATSATRSFQIIFVMDITGSWGEADYIKAHDATLVALDMVTGSASGVDTVGMTIFTNRYSWEYTPLTQIAVPANAAAVRDSWGKLNIASKGGKDSNHNDGRSCALNPNSPAGAVTSKRNNFNVPPGGCYPDMPREYTDEPGTDHSAGVELAKQMFQESDSGANYRAMIVVTDGRPNGLGAGSGKVRAAQHYVETRWREYQGPVPRSANDIRYASIDASQQLWDDLQVNTWVVTLVQDDWFMPAMVHGDGYYRRINKADELAAILAEIISEMPLAIVE